MNRKLVRVWIMTEPTSITANTSVVIQNAATNKSLVRRILEQILLNVLNLTALLTLAGFFVINSYLGTFTTMFSYNISLPQYIAAGINLVLFAFVIGFYFIRFYVEQN